ISGDYFNVIGLPMKRLSEILREILKIHSEW
ncbi:MAG: Maf family protein, partial [Oscillospiraceae bacterium]|nr:Maf family protein [Oscillospiraceae bacterium]